MSRASALSTRLANLQRRHQVASQQIERRLALSAAAGGIGFLESRGTLPVAMFNMPTKLLIGLGAAAAETQFTGSTRRLVGALADAALAVYMHQAAKSRAFIAGEDYVGEDYVGAEEHVGEL